MEGEGVEVVVGGVVEEVVGGWGEKMGVVGGEVRGRYWVGVGRGGGGGSSSVRQEYAGISEWMKKIYSV